MKLGNIRIRWRSVLLGVGIGALCMVCGCAAAAALMAKGAVDLAQMDLFAVGILAASALAGCLTALLGGGGFPDAALTAAGELVVLLALNAGLNGGEMEGAPGTILVLAGGCGAAMLLRINRWDSRKPGRKRRRNR